MTYRITLRPHVVGMFLFASLLISLCLVIAFAMPVSNAHAAHFGQQGSGGDAHGLTAGWYEGETVQFFYTRDFFCEPPPDSGAPSQCEVGEDGQTDPRPDQNIPTLFVMTPLGAQPGNVLKMVIGEGMKLALMGVGLGLIASIALTRTMKSLLFGVSTTDPLTFLGITLLLAAVALFACWIPARRATKVAPLVALRYE